MLAFFSSDLYFDEEGEFCPGCIESLLALQELTDSGTDTEVLGVLVGERGKPGRLLVPEGLTFNVAHEPTPVVQHRYGLSEPVGLVLVGSDGTIATVYDGAATPEEIVETLGALEYPVPRTRRLPQMTSARSLG